MSHEATLDARTTIFGGSSKFNEYDLYSKGHTKPDLKQLKPYYDDLFAEFLPPTLAW